MRLLRIIVFILIILNARHAFANSDFSEILARKNITVSVRNGLSNIEKELLFIKIFQQFNQRFFNDTLKVFISLGDYDTSENRDAKPRWLTCGYNPAKKRCAKDEVTGSSVLCIYSSHTDIDPTSLLHLIYYATNNSASIKKMQVKKRLYSSGISSAILEVVPLERIGDVLQQSVPEIDSFLSQKFYKNSIDFHRSCTPLSYWYQGSIFHVANRAMGDSGKADHPAELFKTKSLQDIRCDDSGNCIIAADGLFYFQFADRTRPLDTISQFLMPRVEITGFGNSCLTFYVEYLRSLYIEVYFDKTSSSFLPRLDKELFLFAHQFHVTRKKVINVRASGLTLLGLALAGGLAAYSLFKINQH